MKKAISVFIAAVLCSSVGVPTARAQDLGGVFDLGMLGRDLSFSAAMRTQAERDAARLASQSKQGSKKSSTAPKGSTRFRPNFAIRERNLVEFVARVRAVDPQSAASLQRDFAKSDPIAAIAPGLQRYGLRTDDVADAAAAYLVSAWYGVRGRNDDPPYPQVLGVREQMRRVMLSVPAFVSASDVAKQQMAEALLMQTIITDTLVTSAKGNPAQMAKVQAAIGQGARNSFYFDLAKMKLTDSGLRL